MEMKIYIQSYHKNSWLWDKVIDNVTKFSNLTPFIVTDMIPDAYEGRRDFILCCGGNNWQQTILNFLSNTEEDIILLSFDDLFMNREFSFPKELLDEFKMHRLSSLKLAHVFRSKIFVGEYLLGKNDRYLTTCAFVLWKRVALQEILNSSSFTPWSFEEQGYRQESGNHASLRRRMISYRNILERGKISHRYSYLNPEIPRKSIVASCVYDLKEDVKYLWRILNL